MVWKQVEDTAQGLLYNGINSKAFPITILIEMANTLEFIYIL